MNQGPLGALLAWLPHPDSQHGAGSGQRNSVVADTEKCVKRRVLRCQAATSSLQGRLCCLGAPLCAEAGKENEHGPVCHTWKFSVPHIWRASGLGLSPKPSRDAQLYPFWNHPPEPIPPGVSLHRVPVLTSQPALPPEANVRCRVTIPWKAVRAVLQDPCSGG